MKIPNKPRTWIVVADGVRARFFAQERPGSAIESTGDSDFVTQGLPDRDRFSDRPGRVHERVGQTRHAMEPPTSPKEKAKQVLAQDVARTIQKAFHEGEFDRLVLVAPPKTLGELRNSLDDHTRGCVIAELPKDISAFKDHEIRAHLAEIPELGPFPQR